VTRGRAVAVAVCAAGSLAAVAALVVFAAGGASGRLLTPRLATRALADLSVRQGRRASFRYEVSDASRSAAADVEIVVQSPTRGAVMTVHLGSRRTNTVLVERLAIGLAPGRYVWLVRASIGARRTSASAAAGSLTVERRVVAPVPAAPAIARAAVYLRSRDADAALAIVDTHARLHGYNLDKRFVSASVVKAMLLVEYLREERTVTAGMRGTLTAMITESDNDAAFRVYARVGAGGLRRLARLAGMTRFAPAGDVLYSRITAADQARFFYRMDAYLPAGRRAFARRLLSHVCARQTWGVAEIARPRWTVFFKSGWFGAAADPYTLVNQVARLERGRLKWSLAVLSDDNPASPYAFVTLRGVFSMGPLSRRIIVSQGRRKLA